MTRNERDFEAFRKVMAAIHDDPRIQMAERIAELERALREIIETEERDPSLSGAEIARDALRLDIVAGNEDAPDWD